MSEKPAIDVQRFKDVMARWPSGVSVVTTVINGKPVGITVSAFMSLGINPPSIIISIDKRSYMVNAIKSAGRFAVTFLNENEEGLSRLFASGDENKFRAEWTEYRNGLPYIRGDTAVFAELYSSLDAPDHVLFIGRVIEALISDKSPLIYYNRKYFGIREIT